MDVKARRDELQKTARPVLTLLEHGLWMDCYADWVSAVAAITGDDESAKEAIRAARELVDLGFSPPVDEPTDDELFPNLW